MHIAAPALALLPTSRPSVGAEELEALRDVLASGWLGQGSVVFKFEAALRDYLGAADVVAVGSGTAALQLALEAAGVGPGDEVIVPSLTFCASVQAITALGAHPVFCEVSARDLNVDPADVAARITSRTKAIMPVHYAGNPCAMDVLWPLARDHGLRVIEDAAHAFGSTFEGVPIGGRGDLTCFSFDPIKNITCGEGGAIALRDPEAAALLRRKRLLGIDNDAWHRLSRRQAWHYDVAMQGYRYHMSNLNAAIGLAQLGKFAAFAEKKRRLVAFYNERLGGLPGLSLLAWDLPNCCPFAYTVRVLDHRRDALAEHLRRHEIGCGLNYQPNHLHTYFRRFATPLPVTEALASEILSLPLFCDMSDDDAARVATAVADFMHS